MTDLASIVARVESAGNQWAMRFEPAVYDRPPFPPAWDACVKANRCSRATGKAILSMSWGLYQIMGFNLYDRKIGLDVPVGVFMSDTIGQGAARLLEQAIQQV